MDKKFIEKEYVKVPVYLDKLKLRLTFENYYTNALKNANKLLDLEQYNDFKYAFLEIIRTSEFANQILEFNKIVNTKFLLEVYDELTHKENKQEIISYINQLKTKYIAPFLSKTEGVLKQYKIKKLSKN